MVQTRSHVDEHAPVGAAPTTPRHASRAARPAGARAGRLAHDARLPREPPAARDGRLLEIEPTWTAEAERYDGEFAVASAAGATVEEAWARLRTTIEAQRATTSSRVRVLRS